MLENIFSKLSDIIGLDSEKDAIISPSKIMTQEFMRTNHVEELLPYLSFDEENEIYINKDSVGFAFESVPLVGVDESLEDQLESIFQHILPEESSIEFMLYASNKIDWLLDSWVEERDNNENAIYKKLAEKRSNHFKSSEFKTSRSLARNYRLIISYSQKSKDLNKVELEKLVRLKKTIIATLEANGIFCQNLLPEGLINLLSEIINFNLSSKQDLKKWNKLESISKQVGSFESNLILGEEEIYVDSGKSLIKNFQVTTYPDEWDLRFSSILIGDAKEDLLKLSCPYLVHFGIYIENQEKIKPALLAKGFRTKRLAESDIAKFLPSIREEGREWGELFIDTNSGSRIVRTSLSVTLFSSKEDIVSNEEILKALYRKNGFSLEINKYLLLAGLISCLPMTWSEGLKSDLSFFKKIKTTTSKEPAQFLPIQADWKGTRSKGLLLLGRRGQVQRFSPFDNNSGNYNMTIIGTSGSGKSVFMQDLITSHLGIGCRAFILDKGRSYEKLTKLLKGRFVEFTSKTKLCLNPFSNIPAQDAQEIDNALAMLIPIIASMAAPIRGISDIENGYIAKAVKAVWDEKGTDAGLDDIVLWFEKEAKKSNDKTAKDLSVMLMNYSKKGVYGSYFNGKSNFDIENPIICFELEELASKKDLQAVIIQTLLLQISNKMLLGDRKTPFMVVIDEAWDLLRCKESGEFIEKFVRCCRKAFGSIVVGTQNIRDFHQSPAASACLNNSDWKCFLRQNPETIDQMKVDENFKLDDHKANLMKTLKTVSGKYSEVLIANSGNFTVSRLILDEYSNFLYSTKAADYSKVTDLVNDGLSVDESITKILKAREYV